jgi:hypothetical protein
MNTADIIGVFNVVAQFAVAVVAVWAVLASLRANKRQIESGDRQLKEQIKVSDIQIQKQIAENRRLATEERQHQNRPIMVPGKAVWGHAVTFVSLETGKANESFYGSDGRVNWSWQHEIGIYVHNMGNGPAFNVHCILYGSEDTCQSQFVSWNNGPIEGKGSIDIILAHSSELRLFHDVSIDGKHPLYDTSLDSPTKPWSNRIACFTLTYHDLSGKRYVSVFHYTLQHRWVHVATEEISGEPPLDLKELNAQKKQGPKLSAPPIITSQGN